MSDLKLKEWAIIIIILSLILGGAIYLGLQKGIRETPRNAFPTPTPVKEIVYVNRYVTPTPVPVVVPTPEPTWAIPAGACIQGKGQRIDIGALSGHIKPERTISLINWFNGKVWRKALPQIEERARVFNVEKRAISRIDGGIFDQVLLIKDGELYCLFNVNVDAIVFGKDVRAYAIDIDSVVEPGKKMRLTSFEKESGIVMYAFSSDKNEVGSYYYNASGSDSSGSYSSSPSSSGSSSPSSGGGGPVTGGA